MAGTREPRPRLSQRLGPSARAPAIGTVGEGGGSAKLVIGIQLRNHYTPAMPIFVFRSENDRRQLAFTSDRTGGNLPTDLGPWRRTSNGPVPSVVGLSVAVQAAIKAKGYVLLPTGRGRDDAPAGSRHPSDEGAL